MENNQEPSPNPFEKINNHWGMHLFRYITIIFAAMFGGATLGYLSMLLCQWVFGISVEANSFTPESLADPKMYYSFWIVQGVSSIGVFLFPVLVQSSMMRQRMGDYLDIRDLPKPFYIIPALVGTFCIIILNSWIIPTMTEIGLPGLSDDLLKQAREAQEQSIALQQASINASGVLQFIFQALMIALMPAILEELFFRKLSLKMIFNITRNVHVSIGFSAFLFALIHFQLFNFVPLFLFGIFLGYLALWSKSIWLPILVHFTNNFLALIIAKMNQSAQAPEVVQDNYVAPWYVLLSALVLLGLLIRMMYLHYRNAYE